MQITKETNLIVSLAAKQNSIGAAMHNAGYQALGLNFVYIPITTDDIVQAITGVRGFNLVGNTVSMPHKQAVMEHLDEIDEVAKTIGAVNTVHNVDGKLIGYNSDWVGAMAALKEVTEIEGKKVIVIGAGGAARAIVYGLAQNKAQVTIYGRTADKARSLADDFGVTFGGDLSALDSASGYDIVINATPVGSAKSDSDESLVDQAFFKSGTVAMDVVTVPTETQFLKNAQAKGAKLVYGYRMLIHQALFQFELFTGQKPPFEVMEEALLAAVEAK